MQLAQEAEVHKEPKIIIKTDPVINSRGQKAQDHQVVPDLRPQDPEDPGQVEEEPEGDDNR